jgi:signal transduction histidine kinase
MKFVVCIIVLFPLGYLDCFGIGKETIEKRVRLLHETPDSGLHDSVKAIIGDLFQFDHSFSHEIVVAMRSIAKDRNKDAELDCLNALASFTPGKEIELIDEAYAYAEKNKLDYYKTDYFFEKSNFMWQLGQIDSSMFYLLKARDLAKVSNPERYVHILQKLGDLYYTVGLYDDAERYYLQVKEVAEGKLESWKTWRRTVITSDLALVAMQRGQYRESIAVFNRMANERARSVMTYGDSLAYCYNRRKVAEVDYMAGNYKEAQVVIDEIHPFFEKYHLEEHLIPTYLLLIRLAIKANDRSKVKRYNQKYLDYMKTVPSPLEYRTETARIESEVNEYLGNNLLALHDYKRYRMLNDSLTGKDRSAAIVQLVAEKDYEALENDLTELSVERYYLIAILLLIAVSAIIIYLRSRKISQLNRLLIETNQTKEKLFSVIAHDLLSPFNALVGLSDIVVTDLKTKNYGEAEELARLLNDESKTLHDRASKLLNWTRSQQGQLQVKPEVIPVDELIRQAITLHERQAGNKSIQVNFESSGNQSILADRNMMATVFANLLVNALKFTPEHGSVRFSTVVSGSFLEVSVSDSGIGMSKEKLAGLFDVAGNKSTPGTNHEQGTGLGLLICKEFVEKNNGTIEVESEPGKGTCFKLRLKLA